MRVHTRATVGLVQVEPTVIMRKETPARPWREELVVTSSLNIISLSTRGMVTPHRQEMLDFQMNDSNFVKMIRMRESAGIISIQC